MASLTISGVRKSYGSADVIHGIDLEVGDGELAVFVGPSGCGKSTLLRMIAGLEEVTSGEIRIGGRTVNDVSPAKRGVAMVFQTYALYPHMTVYKNMAFGLRQARVPKGEIDRRVRAAAESLQITELLDRMPGKLSGGQRQRVAIGRAIVRDPEIFLFDEPLSNLDAALRVQTRLEIARLHERLGATMVYVTHDQVEAMTLADRIVVLNGGRIEQSGPPSELYSRPGNVFVAEFIGSPKMNFFAPSALRRAPGLAKGARVGIRPEHLKLSSSRGGLLKGRLELVEHLGEYALAHLIGDGGAGFIAKIEEPEGLSKGEELWFSARKDRIHAFDGETGRRI